MTNDQVQAASTTPRLEMLILLTARNLRRAFDGHLRSMNLNMTQARLLALLDQTGARSQRELADLLSIGRAAAGTLIDELETRGLVERRPDPADRRVWQIHLTDLAADMVAGSYEMDERLTEALRAGLSRQDRQTLIRLLKIVNDNAESAMGMPPASTPQR